MIHSTGSKAGRLISRSRGTKDGRSNAILWTFRFACLCLFLFVCADTFGEKKSTSVSRINERFVMPRKSRVEVDGVGGGREAIITETTGVVASPKDVQADEKRDTGDPLESTVDEKENENEEENEEEYEEEYEEEEPAVYLRPRTEDDWKYTELRKVSRGLNPHVSTELKMKDGWVDTPFDELVAWRLEMNW